MHATRSLDPLIIIITIIVITSASQEQMVTKSDANFAIHSISQQLYLRLRAVINYKHELH